MKNEEYTKWKQAIEERLSTSEKVIDYVDTTIMAILEILPGLAPRKWYDTFAYGALVTIVGFILLGLILNNGG